MKYKIYNQDVIEWAKEYQKGKFHALLCDAPYHLTSIVKRFGKKNSAPAKHGTDGVFSRSSKGFMGQQWDGGDIAFRPETWEALGEHLYPGAFGMAFSASRNWHRMAVAIEDAGFIIHPTIFGWLNGQGFPKATRIDTQIQPKAEQTIIGKSNRHNSKEFGKGGGNPVYNTHPGGIPDLTMPTDEIAKRWLGHRYGLQALKPAVEPIIVFQKPYEGRPLDNIVETGAGALDIDGARIPLATDDEYTINTFDDGAKPWGNGAGHKYTSRKMRQSLPGDRRDAVGAGMFGEGTDVKTYPIPASGRWPANFILDESVAGRLDVQSNNVSRFFFNVQEQIDEADPIYYCGKVSPKERNAGLDELEDKKSMAQEVLDRGGTSKIGNHNPVCQICSKSKIDRGTGKCICKNPKWLARNTSTTKNPHPTLKPIALAKYLATLLLPPEAYAPRRILVPFSGVGSELIGCALAGWEQIVGIEFDTENGYVEIAHKRMEHWTK